MDVSETAPCKFCKNILSTIELQHHVDNDCDHFFITCPNKCTVTKKGSRVKKSAAPHTDNENGVNEDDVENAATVTKISVKKKSKKKKHKNKSESLNDLAESPKENEDEDITCTSNEKASVLFRLHRNHLEKHLEFECPNSQEPCSFSEIGCDKMIKKSSKNKHLQKNMYKHLMLAHEYFQIVQKIVDENAKKILTLNESAESMSQVLGKLENYQTKPEIKMIWRIDQISEQIKNARAETDFQLHSQQFEVYPCGYQMMAVLVLLGESDEAGVEYSSVFVALCRGTYDNLLKWPFTHRICISLLFQTEIENVNDNTKKITKHATKTIHPNPLPENLMFLGRPLTQPRNGFFGIPRFCPLNIIENNSDYQKDNAIFIKIEIFD